MGKFTRHPRREVKIQAMKKRNTDFEEKNEIIDSESAG